MSEIKFSKFDEETGEQLILDASSLASFQACPRRYYYSILQRLRKAKPGKPSRQFGRLYHTCLEQFDTVKFETGSHEEAVRQAVRTAIGLGQDLAESSDTARTADTLLRAVVWYTEQYRDDSIECLALPDGKPAIEVRFEVPIPGSDYRMSGRVDKIGVADETPVVIDRKTTRAGLNDYYWRYYEVDTQISTYVWAMQQVYGDVIDNVLIDATRTLVGSTEFARRRFFRSPPQIAEYAEQLPFWLNAIEACHKTGIWPQVSSSCSDYEGCDYLGLCALSPNIRDAVIKDDYIRRER